MRPQPPADRGIRRRDDAGLLQHAGAVQLVGRLNDPRQHQVMEHLIPARRLIQPQYGIAAGRAETTTIVPTPTPSPPPLPFPTTSEKP